MTLDAPPFASPRISLLDGFDIAGISAGKLSIPAKRLMAFLAIGERWLNRDYVAYSLWPEASEGHATSSLRNAVWQIRERAPQLLSGSSDVIGIGPGIQVDYHVLRREAFDLRDRPLDGEVHYLVDAFSKDLLPEWYDEWIDVARARWLEIRLHALDALAIGLVDAGRHMEAIDAAITAVAIDPIRDTSRRTLIRAYHAEGNPGLALRELDRFRVVLRRELDIEPAYEIVRLAQSGGG